jgi:hypothetical protein
MMKSLVLLLCLAGTFPEVIAREQPPLVSECSNGYCPLRTPKPVVHPAEPSPTQPSSQVVILPSESLASPRVVIQQRTSRRVGCLRRCWQRVLRR